MLPLYVFALILGGGFLAVSLFGDALDADVDADTDLDGLELDTDAGAQVHGSGGGWSKLFSIRSLVYALFGFGAVGTILHLLRAGDLAVSTALFASAGGVLSGALISVLFGFVKGSESGDRLSEDAFRGVLGRVSLPLGEGSVGQIIVTQGTRTLRLPARVHPAADDRESAGAWKDVVVIDMEKGVAMVAPAARDLLASPDSEGER